MSNRSTFFFFFYCNKSSFSHSAKELWTKLTVLPVLDRGDEAIQVCLSFSPILFFFFTKRRKKSSITKRMLFFMLLSALWLELHSTFSTAARLLCWTGHHSILAPFLFLLIYKILIGEILLLQSLPNIHNTNRSLRSGNFINLHIPPLAPLLRFLLESSTTDLKAKLHRSTHLL